VSLTPSRESKAMQRIETYWSLVRVVILDIRDQDLSLDIVL